MEVPQEDYDFYAHVMKRVTTPLDELLQATDELISAGPISAEELNSWGDKYNLSDSQELFEELNPDSDIKSVETDEFIAPSHAVRVVSTVINAHIRYGHVTYGDAMKLIDAHLTNQKLGNLGKATVSLSMSAFEGHSGNISNALRYSRKAVSYAIKADTQDLIFLAKLNEAMALSDNPEPDQAIKKLRLLWDKFEADFRDGRHDLPAGHAIKALKLMQGCYLKKGSVLKAAETQDTMFAMGYSMETGAEFSERVARQQERERFARDVLSQFFRQSRLS